MSAERWTSRTDAELGAAVHELRHHLSWPPPSPVAAEVAATIRERRHRTPVGAIHLSLPSRRRTVLVVAGVLLLLAATAFAAKLVLDIGAVTVELIPGRPTALPSTVAKGEDFGRPVSLSQAGTIAGFEAQVPTALGDPDRVWVDRAKVAFEPAKTAARIVLAWRPGSALPRIPGTDFGAVLMQFEGDDEVASKILFEDTNRLGRAIVDGMPAFWTTGEHELRLLTEAQMRRYLVTGGVLLWQDEARTYRLETSLNKAEDIRIAESLGPGRR